MRKHFESIYKYNHWCNEQMIKLIASKPDAYSERAQTLFGHILCVHHIWITRVQRIDRTYGVWDTFTINELTEVNKENFESSMYVLERFDYEYLLKYTNTKDETHTNRVKDILFHIVNHSTYHRGQLMTELKAYGAKPVPLDFSYFKELNL